MSELRKDPVTGRWVIISTERGRRPSDFLLEKIKSKVAFALFARETRTRLPRKSWLSARRGVLPMGPDGVCGWSPINFPPCAWRET